MSAVFAHSHRVTYADCTMGDHVYYGRYLELLEAARGEMFRQQGCTLAQWQQLDAIFPVVECHLRYLAPARYDDVLRIELRIARAQGVRLNFDCRILNQTQTPILEASTWHVCTTVAGKPRRLPPELISGMQDYLAAS